MYGFSEGCRPQSEEHRKDVIAYMEGCRAVVAHFPDDYDDDEISKIDEFIKYITGREIEQSTEQFRIEISKCGAVDPMRIDGTDLEGDQLYDMLDCAGPGDAEPACHFILETYNPQFRITKEVDGEYQNVIASAEDKREVCEEIFGDSDSDFSDELTCNLYLVWEAAYSCEREVYST
jgi:hypothetical protein